MSDCNDKATAPRENNNAKPYEKPALRRGPLLSRATGAVVISGATSNASDIRLKRDLRVLTRLDNGLTLYRFRYLWSDVEMVGVMAQEVLEVAPEAVIAAEDGYYRVDYERLGLRFMTYADWLSELPLADAA